MALYAANAAPHGYQRLQPAAGHSRDGAPRGSDGSETEDASSSTSSSSVGGGSSSSVSPASAKSPAGPPPRRNDRRRCCCPQVLAGAGAALVLGGAIYAGYIATTRSDGRVAIAVGRRGGDRERRARRLVVLAHNDVYKLVGRRQSAHIYVGEVRASAAATVVDLCAQDHAGCFPGALVGVAGVNVSRQKLASAKVPGLQEPLLIRRKPREHFAAPEEAVPEATFGNVFDLGLTAQALRRHWEQEERTAVLFVHGGDFLGPSWAALRWKGEHMVSLMNHMGVDLAAFGNHEFDFQRGCPPENASSAAEEELPTDLCLAHRMQQSNFRWLGANVRSSAKDAALLGSDVLGGALPLRPSPSLAPLPQRSAERAPRALASALARLPRNPRAFPTKAGETSRDPHINPGGRFRQFVEGVGDVCFVGTTDATAARQSDSGGNVLLDDDHEVALAELRRARASACAAVVLMTHSDMGRDILLWHAAAMENVAPEVILGSHDHKQAILRLEHPLKPGQFTYLSHLGSDAHLLGELILDFADTGRGDSERAPAIDLRFRVLPVLEGRVSRAGREKYCGAFVDPLSWGCEDWWGNFSAVYGFYAGDVQAMARKKLPLIFRGVYDTAGVRQRETRAGNMLADLSRRAVHADVVHIAAGEIRGDLLVNSSVGQRLSVLSVAEEFPFGDTLGVVEATCLQLVALAHEVTASVRAGRGSALPVLSGLETRYDDRTGELVRVTLVGQRHVRGAMDLRSSEETSMQASLPTPLWDLRQGFLMNPRKKFKLASNQYGLESGADSRLILGLAANLAFVESMCRTSKNGTIDDAWLKLLRSHAPHGASIRCVDGLPSIDYYRALRLAHGATYLPAAVLAQAAAWPGAADIAAGLAAAVSGGADDFVRLLRPAEVQDGRRVLLWRAEACTRAGFRCEQGPAHDEAVVREIHAAKWETVGGESREELERYFGIFPC
eukprot:TRINITY_DN27146_c0_g1_i2.p1 TRINITY_DN27146_c0_g1~~TRINITY_DN27146_c0_g1_i2.p1  ORF type:complete len:965 (-),score=195.89 TRINITY_DN27146_c0_g1_i2:176-3043(-)